jgi:cytochrome c6
MKILGFGVLLTIVSFVCAMVGVSCAATAKMGKMGFEKYCAVCHPEGSNIINPAKTLNKSSLAGNGITSRKDIVRIMRHPGPGMTSFGTNVIPDSEAKEIADYILKTFK